MGTPEDKYKNGDVLYVKIPAWYQDRVDRIPEFNGLYKIIISDTDTSYACGQVVYADGSFGPRIPMFDLIGKAYIEAEGPGPEPTGLTVTLKPLVVSSWDQPFEPDEEEGMVVDGTYADIFDPQDSDATYSVTYNGTTYSNLSYVEPDTSQLTFYIGGIGNVEGAIMRTDKGYAFHEETRIAFVENDLPFALCSTTGSDLIVAFYENEVPETLDITISRTSSDPKSCTLRLTSDYLSLMPHMAFMPPVAWETLNERLDMVAGHKLTVIVNGDEYVGTWAEDEGHLMMALEGYTMETSPVIAMQSGTPTNLSLMIGTMATNDRTVTAAFMKEDDL